MALVQIDPRIASFEELHTFRCFGCGDVRAVEQSTNPFRQHGRVRVFLTEA